MNDELEGLVYILVLWPNSQEYMDEEWFDEEAIPVDFDSIGEGGAYLIPEREYCDFADKKKTEKK